MKRWFRPLLEVAMVHGLLGWVYVAIWAAIRPHQMSEPITAVFPLRRDTFGAACFAVSALAAFTLQVRGELPVVRRPARRGPVDAALRTVVAYALFTWTYLSLNSFTHPETLAMQLTHFSATPTEGTTAAASFAGSALALLVLRARGEHG